MTNKINALKDKLNQSEKQKSKIKQHYENKLNQGKV